MTQLGIWRFGDVNSEGVGVCTLTLAALALPKNIGAASIEDATKDTLRFGTPQLPFHKRDPTWPVSHILEALWGVQGDA